MEKVIVTGAGGLLGARLVSILSEDYRVIPTHNIKLMYPDFLMVDVSSREAVFRAFDEVSPTWVVHSAAATNVDRCEIDRDWAWNVNAMGTRNIAQACAKWEAKLVYVSTDYVFDGAKGLYVEEDSANPVNYYGLTKLQGEEFVKELCRDFIIARTSVVYGWHPGKPNFATWVIDSLKAGRKISVVDDHYNSPTLADDLAEMIRRMLEVDVIGVYHAAGGERTSRYEFSLKIAETFGLDGSLVKPVKMDDVKFWVARRPRDSSLCVDKLRSSIGISPSDLARALEKMRDQQK